MVSFRRRPDGTGGYPGWIALLAVALHTAGQGDGRFHQLIASLTELGTRLRGD
jgi:hypothetical protein